MPSGEPTATDEALGQATELHQQGRLTEAEQAYRQILAREPRHFVALHRLAIVALQQGRLDEALREVDAALQVEPRAEPALLNKGTILYGLGRAEEALAVYRALLDINPCSVDAHFNIANALLATDRPAQAAESFARAAVLRPDDVEVRRRHAEALARAGRPADAIASLDAALALDPEALRLHYERAALLLSQRRYQDAAAAYEAVLARSPGDTVAMNNRGLALLELGRLQEALASYDAAVAIKPEDLDLWYNRGNALARLEQSDAALASYDRVLAGNPDHARALTNRANLLRTAGRAEEALASYQRVLALAPGDAATHTNMGNALRHLNRHSEALAAHERALAIDAGLVEALINRGIALKDLDRIDDALASYARALALAPDHAEALYNQGLALGLLNRHEQALASHERALAADPNHRHALGAIADAALRICDWARMERLRPELERRIGEGRPVVGPFTLIGYADDPPLQLKCTRAYMADRYPLAMPALWRRTGPGSRLRIAYLSADFQRHATAFLMAELLELHDRSRFEVVGVSWGKDDGSTTRTRLVGAFDRFLDVGASSDLDVARRPAADEVSIAVDLKGLTGSNRIGILSHRPAPIQVAYLGYPATSGASFIDYVLADPVVLPLDQQQHWTETIVHLPGCYQANDRRRAVPTAPPLARGERPSRHRLRVLLVQQQLEDHRARVRHLDAAPARHARQRALVDRRQRGRKPQPPPCSGPARRCTGAADLRAACRARGASGPPSPGRPVPRYAPLQRPHHGQRRPVDGDAGADLPGQELRRPRRRQPAPSRRDARAGVPQPRGLRADGAAARPRAGDAGRDQGEARDRPLDRTPVRHPAPRPRYRGGLHDHVGNPPARRSPAQLCRPTPGVIGSPTPPRLPAARPARADTPPPCAPASCEWPPRRPRPSPRAAPRARGQAPPPAATARGS